MFVPPASHASHLYAPFPAKPRPLQPIFTYAQSQSCMNFGMDILDRAQEGSRRCIRTDSPIGLGEGPGPAKPQLTYKSPLQRIGEALRAPHSGSAPASSDSVDSMATPGVARSGSGLATPQSRGHVPPGEQSPTRGFPNYSYKLLPGGKSSPPNSGVKKNALDCSEQGYNGSGDRQGNGFLVGTGLHSSLSSNPRTRAPFKPQKSNRGTSSWQLKQYAEATLGSGSLRKAVKLPEGEDKDEWLAVNGRNAPTSVELC